MPIKTLRLQIIKPYNSPDEVEPVTWDEMGQLLRDLRYQSSKMANFIIQKYYEWANFQRDFKQKNGVYPSAKEHKDKSYFYPMLRQAFPDVATNIVNQVRQQAEKIWKSKSKDVFSLRASIPSFKLNFPICIYHEGYSFRREDQNYIISVGLKPRSFEKTRYEVIIKAGEKSKRVILDRLIEGEYKKGALQIVSDRKGKWYCLIPYEFTQQAKPVLDENKIMGVDLGIANAAYWAFSDSLQRGKIEGSEIEVFRKRVQERRKSIQRQGKQCADGRIGHGRNRRLLPVDILEEKESNFRKTTNHRYARRIVDEAVRQGCGTIQVEDLSGIHNLSTFLKNWPYFDLQQKIIEKATLNGIQVRRINPEYTSQRCSRCGHIEKANRPDQATFICKNCGYGDLHHCFHCGKDYSEGGSCPDCGSKLKHIPVHADYNAARNIATPGIEEIIKNTLITQDADSQTPA